MKRGGEYIEDAGAVADAAVSSVRHPPPEERGSAEEADVLHDMNAFMGKRVVVERRQMPYP